MSAQLLLRYRLGAEFVDVWQRSRFVMHWEWQHIIVGPIVWTVTLQRATEEQHIIVGHIVWTVTLRRATEEQHIIVGLHWKKIGRFDSMSEFCRCLQNVPFAFVK